MEPRTQAEAMASALLRVRGRVQGVGFRPFAARLAAALGLSGRVRNDLEGVLIFLHGSAAGLERYRTELLTEAPSAAQVSSLETLPLSAADAAFCAFPEAPLRQFEIIESGLGGALAEAVLAPDLALCPECRSELLSTEGRRAGYAFINCTQCGPRYSIVHELPYDRANTSMRGFALCPSCSREYKDPKDRRFHAEPNACPVCGPTLRLSTPEGGVLAEGQGAITAAVEALKAGRILAVKGIGGYHLLGDARSEATVSLLRIRKQREAKPLAVLFPSLASVRETCDVSEREASLLESPAAPIVLLRRKEGSVLPACLAPGNPFLGVMLPYAPLHLLLCKGFDAPLIATSGNRAEEPLCIEEGEAFERLSGIADLFLTHNRPIVRPVDDSVLRSSTRGPVLLRRARGYAPFSLPMKGGACAEDLLCLGGHLKAVVAVWSAGQLVLGPHIGDLSTAPALVAYRRSIELLVSLFRRHPTGLVCDRHPDYASTRYALESGLPVLQVQHHLAHVLSCLAEHPAERGPVLGFAWDGTGYGEDRSIWGGEFIEVNLGAARASRRGKLLPFRLPGGEAAVKDARRSALALLQGLGLPSADFLKAETARLGLCEAEARRLLVLLERGTHAPLCTSMGRLFDGVAALLGLGGIAQFEGQNAMALEFAALRAKKAAFSAPLAFEVVEDPFVAGSWILDWRPALRELLRERGHRSAEDLAARFHAGLALAGSRLALRCGATRVALTGGCFQNTLLLELCAEALEKNGIRPLLHKEVPPNDGGLCVGQALAVCEGLLTLSASV